MFWLLTPPCLRSASSLARFGTLASINFLIVVDVGNALTFALSLHFLPAGKTSD